MNTSALTKGIAGFVLLGMSACAQAEPAAARADSHPQPQAQPLTQPLTQAEVRTLAQPEPGAAPADYQARPVTLRLFGTQGEGDTAFATVADTESWATTNYRVGDTIGRGLKITAIRAGGIDVTAAGQARTLRTGEDLPARLLEHESDRAALDHGQHRWTVKARVLAQILARSGLGALETEAVDYGGIPARRLGPVQAGSVLARLGLRRGDLLLALDGAPAGSGTLPQLGEALTRGEPGRVVMLQIVRGGSMWEAAYAVE